MHSRVVFHLQENSMGKDSIINRKTDTECKVSNMQTRSLFLWMITGQVQTTTDYIIDLLANQN